MSRKFIAYTFRGKKEWNSAPYDTREQAARQAFACFPKLKSVETCEAFDNGIGMMPSGRNIQAVTREQAGR